jgi:succinyl-diaminopimelate desuccinylase
MNKPMNVRSQISSEVDASAERLIGMARSLVAAASPNPPGDVTQVAAAAFVLLSSIPNVTIERHETAPGIVNLVARIDSGKPGRRLIFNGHLDTFPVGEDMRWTVPPLGGTVKEGRIYGRGISDMKGGIAASLLASEILARNPAAWRGEIVITLAGDEETMGNLGTRWLLDNVPHAHGDAMICGDVGSPSVVRFGEKGLFWIEVEALGNPAHGAHVHSGVNAIDRLRAALDALKQLERIPVALPDGIDATIEAAKPISELISGAGEANTLRHITVNIGVIEGGVSPNLVPTRAIAKVDIRVPVGATTKLLEDNLNIWLGELDGVNWRIIQRAEALFTDPTHEIVQRVVKAATEVLGKAPALNMRVGASDARLYRLFGIPSVVYGPTPFGMGGPDEHVLVDELVAIAKVHALAAFDFLSAS